MSQGPDAIRFLMRFGRHLNSEMKGEPGSALRMWIVRLLVLWFVLAFEGDVLRAAFWNISPKFWMFLGAVVLLRLVVRLWRRR